MIGDLLGSREPLEYLGGTKLVDDETGGIDGDFGQVVCLGGPDRVVLEEFAQEVTMSSVRFSVTIQVGALGMPTCTWYGFMFEET